MFHLQCDESAVVRSACLQCMYLTVKTLPLVLERVRDVSENIRRLTYEVSFLRICNFQYDSFHKKALMQNDTSSIGII